MNRLRVLLADDHKLVLEAFTMLLESECEIVGTVSDGRELLTAAPGLQPDVVVLDIAMPNLNGLDAAMKLRQRMPDVKVIFLTMNDDPGMVKQAFAAGANGYLLKSSASSELFRAIQTVSKGKIFVTPLLTNGANGSTPPSLRHRERRDKLTLRQREVLQLLAEGHTMNKAASILNLTPRTIAYHKYQIMDNLQIRTNSELIQFAIRQGLVN